ncbi:MAG: NifB/NifX family molybdenum-iron cluster-binding protein, partial [Deltaproteobacteria bacterium]|nr:NifB/NifX family molybdenum-iron cluster-binding protein [Deltaproteobacteria bacterium]
QIRQPQQIAITAKGPNLDSEVDLQFGRAEYFILIRLDDELKTVLTNEEGKVSGRGVGVKNSQRLIDAGAEVVVTGRIGPKVMNVMSAQGISIFLVNGGTVRDAFEQYKQEQTANG